MTRTQREAALATLTPAEREFVEAAIRHFGLSMEQLGTVLGISHEAVRKRRRGAYDKLGVSTRTELVVLYGPLVVPDLWQVA